MNQLGSETCHTCQHSYQGADLKLRCRLNGLQAKPALWEDCTKYQREPGSDDNIVEWCGRGD